MTAVVLTQVTLAEDYESVSLQPRLLVGAFDVIELSPTASASFIQSMVLGRISADDEATLRVRDAGRSLVSTAAHPNAYILVAESLEEIANLCDARTMR
jgi:hypothetical protein